MKQGWSMRLMMWMGTAMVAASVTASALTLDVYPGDAGWISTGNSGGGSSQISVTAPRSGDGSVELYGDRTRFQSDPTANLGLLSDVTDLAFDWMIASDSANPLNPDYTPALRLLVWDPTPVVRGGLTTRQTTELIWEGAYNGYYNHVTEGTWYSPDVFDQTLWRSEGAGVITKQGTAQLNQTVTAWANDPWYSSGAYIYAISLGVGSSASAKYHAFADNITLGFGHAATTWNFEVAPSAVPEPVSTVALLGMALAALACGVRRRVA